MKVDEIALQEFLHTAYPRLVAAVALACGSRPAAEDAVQEALLRAWQLSESGQEIESLNAWVTTVALNQARSGLRRIMAERRARSRMRAPLAGEPPTGDRIDVERALSTLSRRQREAVVLRYYLQLDTQEVEGRTEPQFWLGGDAGNADAIRCEPYQGGRAFISATSHHPIEGPGDTSVIETTFVLQGGELRVVDVKQFTWPANDDAQPFHETTGCGTDLDPYA